MRSLSFALLVSLLTASAPVVAQNAPSTPARAERSWLWPALAFAQVGSGDGVDSVTAGLQWAWPRQPLLFGGGALRGYVELAIGRWAAHDGATGRAISTQIGIAPTLRYSFAGWPQWFVDAAIGVNAITPIFRRGEDEFSTVFNFDEHLGIGYHPAGSDWEWTLRYQHFSNGGVRKPNPGQDFIQLRIGRLL